MVFDTNRLWTAKLPVLAMLFPNAKVICCVRDISWIMDSWEQLYARNPLELSAAFGFKADTTVYSRVSKLASSDGIVGHSLDALREGFYGPWRDRLMMIEYEQFVRFPEAHMHSIYQFIGEHCFQHDFQNVEYSADSYDASLGMPGLHTVSGPVRFTPRETVLPPDLFDRFKNDSFWKDKQCPPLRTDLRAVQ